MWEDHYWLHQYVQSAGSSACTNINTAGSAHLPLLSTNALQQPPMSFSCLDLKKTLFKFEQAGACNRQSYPQSAEKKQHNKFRFHWPLQRSPSTKFFSSGLKSSGRIKGLLTICTRKDHLDYSVQYKALERRKKTEEGIRNLEEKFVHLLISILQCLPQKWILTYYHAVQSNSHGPSVCSFPTIG